MTSCTIKYMDRKGEVRELTDEEYVRAIEAGNLGSYLNSDNAPRVADPDKPSAKTLFKTIQAMFKRSEKVDAPMDEKSEWLRTQAFDSMFPIENAIRASGNSKLGKAFRYVLRTFQAKAEHDKQDLIDKKLNPLVEKMSQKFKAMRETSDDYKKGGYSLFLQDIADIGNLILHGRERNRYILASKHLGVTVEEASKMSNAEIVSKLKAKGYNATQIANAFAGSGRADVAIDELEKLINDRSPGLIEYYKTEVYPELKKLIDESDERLEKSGLLTKEMKDARPKFDWYVPLYGDPESEEGDALSSGKGNKMKDANDKKATGRSGTLADNPLKNVFGLAANSIQREALQGFKKSFVEWAQEPEAKTALQAKVNAGSTKEIFEKYTKADGTIDYRVKTTAASAGNTLVYRDGDKSVVIEIGNKPVLDALVGMNPTVDGFVMEGMTKATRLLSRIYTGYNILSFPLINKMRDVQSQIALVMADAPTEKKAAVARDLAKNNKYFLSGWKLGKWSGGQREEYMKWYDKLRGLGAMSHYTDLFKENPMDGIDQAFNDAVGGKAGAAKKYSRLLGKSVDSINNYFEATSRVALFKSLVENGVDEKEAALYVKNVMNFEVKGNVGRQFAALYPFASVALYDLQRLGRSLRSPRGKVVFAAQLASGLALYSMLREMGGDDDDGIARLDKAAIQDAGSNLLIPDEDGSFTKIPLGFGSIRIAATMAAAMHRYATGHTDTAEFAQNLLMDSVFKNVAPVQPKDISVTKDLPGFLTQTFTPAVFLPLVQLAMNKNYQGNAIHRPDDWVKNKLKFEAGFPATPAIYKDVAEELYNLTGIEVFPEALQHITRSYTGGGGADFGRILNLLGKAVDGESVEDLKEVPIAQAFKTYPNKYDQKKYLERYDEIKLLEKERAYIKGKDDQEALDAFDEKNGWLLALLPLYKQAESDLRGIKGDLRSAQEIEDPKDRQAAVDAENTRMRNIFSRTNAAVKVAKEER